MADKHYNIDYLSDTMKILNSVKHDSYKYFNTLSKGATIVDLGCGTGQDVLNMARVFDGNQFHLIGLDHDPNIISKEKESISSDNKIEFIIGDVSHLPFGDEYIDGVRMERLVQHITDPTTLFTEVYRTLKIGGIIVIVESDWKSISFYNGNLSVADKLNIYLSGKKVNNGRAGQSLSTYLKQIGCKDISLAVFPFVLKNYEDACTYLWIDKMLGEMLSLGQINQKEHDNFIASLKYANDHGFFACSMNIVLASGVK